MALWILRNDEREGCLGIRCCERGSREAPCWGTSRTRGVLGVKTPGNTPLPAHRASSTSLIFRPPLHRHHLQVPLETRRLSRSRSGVQQNAQYANAVSNLRDHHVRPSSDQVAAQENRPKILIPSKLNGHPLMSGRRID